MGIKVHAMDIKNKRWKDICSLRENELREIQLILADKPDAYPSLMCRRREESPKQTQQSKKINTGSKKAVRNICNLIWRKLYLNPWIWQEEIAARIQEIWLPMLSQNHWSLLSLLQAFTVIQIRKVMKSVKIEKKEQAKDGLVWLMLEILFIKVYNGPEKGMWH